jgi:D-sedoheptulose 7-phosphate isomerase
MATIRACAVLEPQVQRSADLIFNCLTNGRKLLVCGNGGSASDATHLATELLCRFMEHRRPYPALSLTANGEFMTAVCNDYSADEIFSRQVWGLGQKGDVLLAITTSGKSRNVLLALQKARELGMESVALLGRDGGFTKGIATVDILAPGPDTARIQEAHKLIFHVICELVDARLPK